MALLEIKNLVLEIGDQAASRRILDGVSLTVEQGETVCLVGESGSGKTLTALSIARLFPVGVHKVEGSIHLGGQEVLKMAPRELRRIRGGVVSYIFQEPGASLNPVWPVGWQIKEALRWHRPAQATDAEVIRLLRMVGIPAPEARQRDYPHQLSGGMQQRVMIAMALASQPQLLVADEPTTALDVTIQAQILDLLKNLQKEQKMALLLITHNLGVVHEIADRVAVMYAGQIVEQASVSEILRQPLHPYTRALLASVPRIGAASNRLEGIAGQVPEPGSFSSACRFAPRCAIARPDCHQVVPGLLTVEPNREVRCRYWNELRPTP